MKKLNSLLLLIVLLTIAGCAKDDTQLREDQSLELRNGNGVAVTKPFKATVSVPVELLAEGAIVGFCDGQFGNFNIINDNPSGSETTVTHLGKISVEYAEACARPYLQADEEVFPPETYGPFLAAIELFPIPGVITQEDIITAANGKDKLYIRSTFYSSPDPQNKFHSLLDGSFEITGGTGKFTGASGGGKLTGSTSADFINPTFPYVRTYDGVITY